MNLPSHSKQYIYVLHELKYIRAFLQGEHGLLQRLRQGFSEPEGPSWTRHSGDHSSESRRRVLTGQYAFSVKTPLTATMVQWSEKLLVSYSSISNKTFRFLFFTFLFLFYFIFFFFFGEKMVSEGISCGFWLPIRRLTLDQKLNILANLCHVLFLCLCLSPGSLVPGFAKGKIFETSGLCFATHETNLAMQ